MFVANETYSGFKLVRSEEVKEINSIAHIFRHAITKTEVIVLSNDDDNKVFMSTFKTPPFDDTGAAHILEHSVLNGSKKYPVKEPFAELLKSSLYTFLNAMTYPDRTVYPIASRNAQDFTNLMDVYLDAVFNPLLTEPTFHQEGWHYHIESADDELNYSGVVYNEMLGAYSDPENVLIEEMNKVLYPDSIYARSSGGNPQYIPELDFEKFVAFHKSYYHPSNCRVLLYGDMRVIPQLSQLDHYFKAYSYQEVDSVIKSQPRGSIPPRKVASYPVSPEDTSTSKTYLLRSYLLGHPTDAEYMLSMSVLSRILSGTSASPLKKALVESRLGEGTLDYGFENDLLDNYYAIGLKGTHPDKVDDMETIIDKTLRDLVDNKIDQRVIEASMNSIEFQLREANFGSYPKGLCYGLIMLNSWLYDADPLMHLRYEAPLKKIKDKVVKGGYFEEMIDNYFLKNPHQSTILLTPDDQLERRRSQELWEKLTALKMAMTAQEIKEILNKNRKLHEYQLTPDSPEALASIPKLSLDCVEKLTEKFPFEIIMDGTPELSFSHQPTNGIAYVTVMLDASGLPQYLLPYVPLFARIVLQVGTRKRGFVELIQEIDIHTGGIASTYSATPIRGDSNKVNSFLSFTCKSLKNKLPKLFGILAEVFTQLSLDDYNRISELIHIAKSNLRSRIIPSGHAFASTRLASYVSCIGQYREITSGISQYHFLESLVQEYEQTPEKTVESLKRIGKTLFNRNCMKIHLTGAGEELQVFKEEASRFVNVMPEQPNSVVSYTLEPAQTNEAFTIPSNIQYVGKGMNLFDLGYQYNGNYEVLDTILTRDYLWNTVRVQGGAYGCFTNMDMLSGNFCCVSYRDPNLAETLDAFDRLGDFVDQLNLSQSDLEKFVIGTMGGIDAPKTPDQKGATAFSRYLSGLSHDDVQLRRDQILSCRIADFKEYVTLFKEFSHNGVVCVIGGEVKILESKDRFLHVHNVFSTKDDHEPSTAENKNQNGG